MTKNLKQFTSEKFLMVLFDQKLLFSYIEVSITDIQITGEAFSPPKRTSSTSKHNFFFFTFFCFCGYFALLDPDAEPLTWLNPGSNPDDPKHYTYILRQSHPKRKNKRVFLKWKIPGHEFSWSFFWPRPPLLLPPQTLPTPLSLHAARE